MVELELPYPPSVNTYWRHVGNKVLISKKGRIYRLEVASIVSQLGLKPISGPVRVSIAVYVPDKRRRDLDNILKAFLDALAGPRGVYVDDSQIMELNIKKMSPVTGGRVIVRVWEI